MSNCPRHNLDRYLPGPVSNLVKPLTVSLEDPAKERHRIFSLLVMAIIHHYWNGNKYGRRDRRYPLNPPPNAGGEYLDKDYLGHNIAAVAVNQRGQVIDFAFNHNYLYNSSVEHAESRLMRRIFSLTGAPLNIEALTGEDLALAAESEEAATKYRTQLPGVSVYTSLEPCSQCAGIMALGKVKEFVFIQADPGMYFIGNILRRLTEGTGLESPLPIPGKEVGLQAYDELNRREQVFWDNQCDKKGEPFRYELRNQTWVPRWGPSTTSFLCTQTAYTIYGAGAVQFQRMGLRHGGYRPSSDALTNQEALEGCRGFFEYAAKKGRRSTPHRI